MMKYKINQVLISHNEETDVSSYVGEIQVTRFLFWKYSLNVFSVDGLNWYLWSDKGLGDELLDEMQTSLKLYVDREISKGNLIGLDNNQTDSTWDEPELQEPYEDEQPLDFDETEGTYAQLEGITIEAVVIVPGITLNDYWKRDMQIITTDRGKYIDNVVEHGGYDWMACIDTVVYNTKVNRGKDFAWLNKKSYSDDKSGWKDITPPADYDGDFDAIDLGDALELRQQEDEINLILDSQDAINEDGWCDADDNPK